MRVAAYSAQAYEREAIAGIDAAARIDWRWLPDRLDATTVALARGADAVSCFVNDDLSPPVLEALAAIGVRHVALRCTGYDRLDRAGAARLGIVASHVPDYSPHAVAEHAIGLVLALLRRPHVAHARARRGNFSLEGLVGQELHGRCVGVVGAGRIGGAFARIALGFGCRVIASDPVVSDALVASGVRYVPLAVLLAEADVVSLHCGLDASTRHLVDADALARMKPGAVLVNTGRGAVVDTPALVDALASGRLAGAALDVYEFERSVFFRDGSAEGIRDPLLARLLSLDTVIVTGHMGFLTHEALADIARAHVANLLAVAETGRPVHAVPS